MAASSDNGEAGKIVKFPSRRPTAEQCRQKVRDLIAAADGTHDLIVKASLLREAAEWLKEARKKR